MRAEPSRYMFNYRMGGGAVIDVGSAPTNVLNSEQAGGFTGVFIGPFAYNGGAGAMAPADFGWFDDQPLE